VLVHNYHPLLVTAVIGGVAGAAIEASSQIAINSTDSFKKRSGKIFAAGVIGAAAGATGYGLAGVFAGAGAGTTASVISASAISGGLGNGAQTSFMNSAIDNKPLDGQQIATSVAIGAATGMFFGAVGGANIVKSPFISPITRSTTVYKYGVKSSTSMVGQAGKLPSIIHVGNPYQSTQLISGLSSAGAMETSGKLIDSSNSSSKNSGTCNVNMSCKKP